MLYVSYPWCKTDIPVFSSYMKETEYKIRPQSHVYGSADISFSGVAEAVPVILSRLHLYYFCNTQVCLCLKANLETFPMGPLADKKNG